MSLFTKRPALRWVAPLALLGVVAGVGLVATTATADPTLPPRSAEQLLVDLQEAGRPGAVAGLSGTVTQQANLGLPELPGGSGSRSSDFNSLLAGSHTLKVWYAGPDKSRVALLGTLGESDLIVNGDDVWTWSSDSKEATHRTLPARERDAARQRPTDAPKTPQEAAERFLAAIGPTTEVSTDRAVTVAGRDAYELVLQPKDDQIKKGSLIREVRIAVDAEKKIPLRVQVYGQGSDPVAEVGFTSVDFAVPDAGQFAFNPPPGTKVTEVKPEDKSKLNKGAVRDKKKLAEQRAGTEVVGTGWTTVVITKTGTSSKQAANKAGDLGALLEQLPKASGSWGSGRVLSGTAFSAVLTDDGRLAVGTVKPAVLYDALEK